MAEAYKLHFSERGIPLVYYGVLNEKPILTVENYSKWYNLYYVYPDGEVSPVLEPAYDFAERELLKIAYGLTGEAKQDFPTMVRGDHIYNPFALKFIAGYVGGFVYPQSEEIIIGRWELEYHRHYMNSDWEG